VTTLNAYSVCLSTVFGDHYNGTAIVYADNEDQAARLVNQEFANSSGALLADFRDSDGRRYGQHSNRERQCKAKDCTKIDPKVPTVFIF
jgi:hypothetical protein